MVEFLSDFWQGFSGQTSYRPGGEYGKFKNDLYRASLGQAPSAAQAQLQSGKEQAMAAAQSQAASARGNTGQRAAAQRAATFGAAAASQQAANQAAALRAQEQAAARQTLADYVGREQSQTSQIELANAAGRQKGYGVIGAVGGGLLGALSDMRAKEQIAPAVALMGYPSSHEQIDARRRAEDAAREEAERAKYQTGSRTGDLIANAGGMLMSDARAKELEKENSLLKRLAGAVSPGPRQTERQMLPSAPVKSGSSSRSEFADEAEFQRAAAQDYENSRRLLLEQRAAEEKQQAAAAKGRAWADWERDALDVETARRGGTAYVDPSYGPAPAVSDQRAKNVMYSDERTKELERDLDAVRNAKLSELSRLSGPTGVERAEEQAFQRWYGERARRLGLAPNPDDPEHKYDYRGAYRAGAEPGPEGHWDSRFKAPDHPNRYVVEDGRVIDTISGEPTPVPTKGFPDAPTPAQSRADLAPLKPYQYSYKPEFAAQQGTDTEPRLGIMAQDALKSPSYQSAVVERPDGMLGLDRDRLLQANTAELAGVDKRLRELEQIKQDALRNIDKARR